MRSPRGSTSLATRSDQVTLEGRSKGSESFSLLLSTEARWEDWRLLELYSLEQRPFEAEVAWSSGAGDGSRALLTVCRSTRVCVVARALRVRVRNLHPEENRVTCNVAEPGGFVGTENQLEVPADLSASTISKTGTEIPIPPMARFVRVDLAEPALRPHVVLRLYDAQSELRTALSADQQPSGGVPLGGTHRLTLTSPDTVAARVVFRLAL